MRLMTAAWLVAWLGCLLPACELEPDVGAPIAPRCSDEDSDPDDEVSFALDIAPLIFREEAGCIPCHDPEQSGSVGFRFGGLDVTSLASLMKGGVNSSRSIVVAGRPCDSVLYLKVSPGPPFGSRMPLDGPPFLTDEERMLVHDWIAEGAKGESEEEEYE